MGKTIERRETKKKQVANPSDQPFYFIAPATPVVFRPKITNFDIDAKINDIKAVLKTEKSKARQLALIKELAALEQKKEAEQNRKLSKPERLALQEAAKSLQRKSQSSVVNE